MLVWDREKKTRRICSLCLLLNKQTIPSCFSHGLLLTELIFKFSKHLQWVIIKNKFPLDLLQFWFFVGNCECPCMTRGKVNRHKNGLGGGGVLFRTQIECLKIPINTTFPPPILHVTHRSFVSPPGVLLKPLSQIPWLLNGSSKMFWPEEFAISDIFRL